MKAEEMTFEKAMTRLEQIVSLLENGGCTLDESLKLFEEGTKLTGYCSKALKTAEQKIVKLTAVEAATAASGENSGEDKTSASGLADQPSSEELAQG